VPAFSDFYGSFHAELPLTTRIIVRGSTLLSRNLPLVVIAIASAAVSAYVWVRRPGHRMRLDRILLGLPYVGDVARKFAVSQLARTLGTLLGGGIPLVKALEVAAQSVGNRYVAQQLEGMAQEVREGQSLAATMRTRTVFPDVAIKMTEVGEATGALQDMLNSLADFYDEEVATNLERFITLVEPVLLITMGIVIAALLLALYMPLFQLSSVVS